MGEVIPVSASDAFGPAFGSFIVDYGYIYQGVWFKYLNSIGIDRVVSNHDVIHTATYAHFYNRNIPLDRYIALDEHDEAVQVVRITRQERFEWIISKKVAARQ